MEMKKAIGGILLALGCAVILIGLGGLLLPLWKETLPLVEQLQSIQQPAVKWTVSIAFSNAPEVVGGGLAIVLFGLLLTTDPPSYRQTAPCLSGSTQEMPRACREPQAENPVYRRDWAPDSEWTPSEKKPYVFEPILSVNGLSPDIARKKEPPLQETPCAPPPSATENATVHRIRSFSPPPISDSRADHPAESIWSKPVAVFPDTRQPDSPVSPQSHLTQPPNPGCAQAPNPTKSSETVISQTAPASVGSNDPRYTPNEERYVMLSPRIRSTVGKHSI